MHRLFALLILPAALLATSACGGDTCGGQPASEDNNAPEVTSFFVLSEDKQIPGDPWSVLFGIDYADANGDLGFAGRSEFYLNSNLEPTTQELDRVFRQSGLLVTDTRGAFWVTLRFAEATVQDGTRVRLGVQLVDSAELRSNCYTLDLEFDVFPIASLERAAPAWSVASTRCRTGGRS